MNAPIRLLTVLLCACTPATTETSDPPIATDTAQTSETPDTGGHTVVVAEDTGVEGISDSEAIPWLSPDGGTFVGETAVTLTSSTGEGEVRYCLGSPGEACTLTAYTGPVTVSASAILYARVETASATGELIARSFVEVTEEVAAFTSGLPVMIFWTDEDAPDNDYPVAMGLDLFEADDGEVVLTQTPTSSGRARLKLRGSSSYGASKPSYDLELWEAATDDDRREALLGMPKEGDWVLYAPYYFDEALIRNALGYQLSNNIGRYAPRSRFAELFVAERGRAVEMDDYAGVYGVTEEIEKGADRVDIAELTETDNQLPELSGGYIIKRDRSGDDESGFWAGDGNGAFSFSYPLVWVDPEESERTGAQQTYIEALIDDLGFALAAPDLTSPQSGLHYSEIIDVESWIDHHILNILFKNPDAFRLSGYMHKDREGLLLAGPLWDLDRTAGGNDIRALDPLRWDATNLTSDTTPAFSWAWYGGMFRDADFRDRYFTRLSELLEGELSLERIHAEIDDLAQTIGEAGDRNAAKWGAADFEGEITDLKAWFTRRHDWMTACLEDYADPRACP
jgi:hypothetical protein